MINLQKPQSASLQPNAASICDGLSSKSKSKSTMVATWAAELMVHRIVALELSLPSRDPAPVGAQREQVDKGPGPSLHLLPIPGQLDSCSLNTKLIASAVSDFKEFLCRFKYVPS